MNENIGNIGFLLKIGITFLPIVVLNYGISCFLITSVPFSGNNEAGRVMPYGSCSGETLPLAEKSGLKHLESYHNIQNTWSTSHPLTNNKNNVTTYIETLIKITNIVIVGLLKVYLIPGTILTLLYF